MDSGRLFARIHKDDRFIKDRGIVRLFLDHVQVLLNRVFGILIALRRSRGRREYRCWPKKSCKRHHPKGHRNLTILCGKVDIEIIDAVARRGMQRKIGFRIGSVWLYDGDFDNGP
jgi:hypothetical protein